MFNLHRVHVILDNMVVNGRIVESSKTETLSALYDIDKCEK